MRKPVHRSIAASGGAHLVEALVVLFFLTIVAVLALRKLGVMPASHGRSAPTVQVMESIRCRPAIPAPMRAHDGHALTRGRIVHVRSCAA